MEFGDEESNLTVMNFSIKGNFPTSNFFPAIFSVTTITTLYVGNILILSEESRKEPGSVYYHSFKLRIVIELY